MSESFSSVSIFHLPLSLSREILIEESNVQRVDPPVTVSLWIHYYSGTQFNSSNPDTNGRE